MQYSNEKEFRLYTQMKKASFYIKYWNERGFVLYTKIKGASF